MKHITSLIILVIVSIVIVFALSLAFNSRTEAPVVPIENIPEEQVPAPTDDTLPHEVVVSLSSVASVAGLSITFNSMTADNRCPTDVLCIEAGSVTPNVTLATAATSTTRNFPSDEVPFEFDGYKISIVKAMPEALSTVTLSDEDYLITFNIEKI